MDSSKLQLQLDRIERSQKILLNALPKKTKTWLTAQVVNELTGWSRATLHQRVKQGLIERDEEIDEKGVKHYKYLLESINPIFLLKNQSHENINDPRASISVHR